LVIYHFVTIKIIWTSIGLTRTIIINSIYVLPNTVQNIGIV